MNQNKADIISFTRFVRDVHDGLYGVGVGDGCMAYIPRVHERARILYALRARTPLKC